MPLLRYAIKISGPICAYLCYLPLKAKTWIKKQLQWKDLLRDHKIKQLVKKHHVIELPMRIMQLLQSHELDRTGDRENAGHGADD